MAHLQPLRNYIRQNIAHLRSTPCLLITSSPPPATISTAVAGTKTPSSISSDTKQQKVQRDQLKFQQQQNNPKVRSFVERNVQSLTLEFNLRTVPCTISSAFPTLDNVDEAVSLARRAGLKEGSGNGGGDGVVIGIGSGAAMDLAKAVSDSLFGNVGVGGISSPSNGNEGGGGGSLVLAPCTLGGMWAASSNSPSLLLDTKEEMILPHLTSSWAAALNPDHPASRRGTVVTLDGQFQLAMPPLYTPFQPVKRSEYSPAPSMAHVAAAVLSIVLDLARSMDNAMNSGSVDSSGDLQQHDALKHDMKIVASSCAAVLQLATHEAKNENGNGNDTNENIKLAQQHLLDAIPRLSPLMEQCSLLSNNAPLMTSGTIPQKLANALLPAYFPQCHLVTYLACILPGLCDVLSTDGDALQGGFVDGVANSIMIIDNDNTKNHDQWQLSSLSSWVSEVTMEAGIPSMASLAYGTPDLNTLVGSLDSYESLVASMDGGISNKHVGQDEQWVMEDIIQRSLSR